jgi:hypothetical protein
VCVGGRALYRRGEDAGRDGPRVEAIMLRALTVAAVLALASPAAAQTVIRFEQDQAKVVFPAGAPKPVFQRTEVEVSALQRQHPQLTAQQIRTANGWSALARGRTMSVMVFDANDLPPCPTASDGGFARACKAATLAGRPAYESQSTSPGGYVLRARFLLHGGRVYALTYGRFDDERIAERNDFPPPAEEADWFFNSLVVPAG